MDLLQLPDQGENSELQECVTVNIVSPGDKGSLKQVESDESSRTEFNESIPIYACKHAYEKNHCCKYVECFNCHTLPSRQDVKVYRKTQKRLKQDTECRHRNVDLTVWSDVNHIKALFRQHPENIPTTCIKCKKAITINGYRFE